MDCGRNLDNMLLNPYGIDLPSLNSHLDTKLKSFILRDSLSPNPECICQILGAILRTTCDFESIENSSSN